MAEFNWDQFEPVEESPQKTTEPTGAQPEDFWGKFEPVEQEKPKERSLLDKGARIATQVGLGVAAAKNIPYELSTIPLNSQKYYENASRQRIGEDLEYLLEKNSTPFGGSKPIDEWSPEDKNLYGFLQDRLQNPEKIAEDVKDLPTDVSIRGLTEKATGLNLHPEDFVEKAANWLGYLKDPTKWKEVPKALSNPKEWLGTLGIGSKELLRSAGAGGALQLAEDGEFGPFGKLAAALVGDYIGKKGYNIIQNPQKAAAEFVNAVTMNNTTRAASADLIKSFEEAGLVMDLGTMTNSPFVKMVQSRLAQSGLTGEALQNARKELTDQFVREFKGAIDDLGEVIFENNHQAGEAVKNAVKVEEASLPVSAPKGNTQYNMNVQPNQTFAPLAPLIQVEPPPLPEQQIRNEFLDSIAPASNASDYQLGSNLKTTAENIKSEIKEPLQERWNQFDEQTIGIEEPQAQLAAELDMFVADHQGSLLMGQSTPEARVVQAAEQLRDQLVIDGDYLGVPLDNLIKTKRTLNDIADYEFGGSDFKSAYKELVRQVDSAITRTLGDYPELLQEFQQLNADYSQYKETFENDNVKNLFEPKNNNYVSIYNSFLNDPDKFRSLEDIMYNDPVGIERVNLLKRKYAEKATQRPITDEEARNLAENLGEEFTPNLQDYIATSREAAETPQRVAQNIPSRGINVPLETPQGSSLKGRKISETGTEASRAGLRKKYYEYIKNKDGNQIMKEFDTLEGIRRARRVMETTPEGKELFKQLSRYKIADIIDRKMVDSATQQVKLGTFSHLANTTKEKAILKELMGEQAYGKFRALQEHAGKIDSSAKQFLNSSQSGTTAADVTAIVWTISSLFSGNPYAFLGGLGTIGGSRVLAQLITDPKFLAEFQKLMLNPSKKQGIDMEAMKAAIMKVLGS